MAKKAKYIRVASVLLADGWHTVLEDSFHLTAMEFADEHGSITTSGWFEFTEYGPHGQYREVRGRMKAVKALASGERKPDFLKQD
jgi:predicted RNA binding protein YcfA (HicA-like mRNA interferase family)